MDNVSEYTLKRALRVYEIYQAHYEAGAHSRSSRWVYFHRVRPVYAISETTYKRYPTIVIIKGEKSVPKWY